MRELRHRRQDSKKHSLQSDSFARRKRKRSLLLVALFVLIISTFVFASSKFSNLSAFSVSVIEVQGASQDIISVVRAAALNELEGDYFRMFSRSNIVLYPRGAIRAAVADASPRIESVSVKHNGLTALVVTVKEKEPVALACTAFPDFEDSSLSLPKEVDCSFVDEEGILFKAAPSISGTMYNRYYVPGLLTGTSTTKDRVGLRATSTSEFVALQQLYAGLRSKGFEVEGILFKDRGEYEAYIKSGARTTVVYFNNAKPLTARLSDLVLFWSHAVDAARAKGKPVPVYEYIDIRYGPNLFFREFSPDTEIE